MRYIECGEVRKSEAVEGECGDSIVTEVHFLERVEEKE